MKRKSRHVCSAARCSMASALRSKKVQFFPFPSEPTLKSLWIDAVLKEEPEKEGWRPISSSRLCSLHFLSGSPSKAPNHPDYVPSIFPSPYCSVTEENLHNYSRMEKLRRKNDEYHKSEKKLLQSNRCKEKASQTNLEMYSLENDVWTFDCTMETSNNKLCQTNIPRSKLCYSRSTEAAPTTRDFGCSPRELKSKDNICPSAFKLENLKTDADFRQILGVSQHKFFNIFLKAKPMIKESRRIGTEEKIALYLMKHRFNLPCTYLAMVFGIERHTASNIFKEISEIFPNSNSTKHEPVNQLSP